MNSVALKTGRAARSSEHGVSKAATRRFTSGGGLALLFFCAVIAFGGCGARHETPELGSQLDRSLSLAIKALVSAQSSDGAWRSRVYGGMKDGLSLTPPILKALLFSASVPEAREAGRRGVEYLLHAARSDGSIDAGRFGLGYPVYTSATAAIVLTFAQPQDGNGARNAWLEVVRARQLTEPLGWQSSDPAYGGWGDSATASVNRPELCRLARAEADLSSTLFALSALRIAGAPADDPVIQKALSFVERCQNFPRSEAERDPAFDDGGFFFSPVEPTRNKAGQAGTDRLGRVRFHSYGSATADGLRALLRSGVSPQSPRVAAAKRWLERHFSVGANPGVFESGREVERNSTYFYYCWSFAHAFRALGVDTVATDSGPVHWPSALAAELIRRQCRDGTWANPYSASKEDDPLVATALAAGALGSCKMMTVGERARVEGKGSGMPDSVK
jgi:squalene-hopene/tetraprenyl-beta-curcumene cyclase